MLISKAVNALDRLKHLAFNHINLLIIELKNIFYKKNASHHQLYHSLCPCILNVSLVTVNKGFDKNLYYFKQ